MEQSHRQLLKEFVNNQKFSSTTEIMSQRNISEQIKSLYDADISPELEENQRKDHAGGKRLAKSSAGVNLSLRILRRHLL